MFIGLKEIQVQLLKIGIPICSVPMLRDLVADGKRTADPIPLKKFFGRWVFYAKDEAEMLEWRDRQLECIPKVQPKPQRFARTVAA